MVKKKHGHMQRKGIYSIEEVLSQIKPFANDHDSIVYYDGDPIRMNSHRYHTFATYGITCCECGLEGKFFAKEKTRGSKKYHFNLYAIDKHGDEVLITKDHVIPKADGGPDHITNYRTMCKVCNEERGIRMQAERIEKQKVAC